MRREGRGGGKRSTEHYTVEDLTVTAEVSIGDAIEFSFTLRNIDSLGKLRLEYAIGFLRNNGSHSKKVFKISESEVSDSEKQVSKSHSFKAITTRKYYPGKQYLSIIANGVELAEAEFELK